MLLPEVRSALETLDAWEAFLATNPTSSPGIVSSWGSIGTHVRDFITSPFGPAWFVEREVVDRTLGDRARHAGVCLLQHTEVASLDQTLTDWEVRVLRDATQRTLRADCLILAVGRSGLGSRWTGPRIAYDRLIAIGRIYAVQEPTDARLWLEACEHGWVYSIPSSSWCRTFVAMTDSDMKPDRAGAHNLHDRLSRDAHQCRSLLRDGRLIGKPCVIAAQTTRRSTIAGDRWVCVGDAAFSHDPLFGQGVVQALRSGIDCADAVVQRLGGRSAALVEFGGRSRDEFDDYLRTKDRFYEAETRWPNSTFWRRRRSSPTPSVRSEHAHFAKA